MIDKANCYLHIPELSLDVDYALRWYRANLDKFHQFYHGLVGCAAPGFFANDLNRQFDIDLDWFNSGMAIVKNAMFTVQRGPKDCYPEHVDPRRCASINFLLSEGDSLTIWKKGDHEVTCPYEVGEAMLFNTQIPHRVDVYNRCERVLLTFTVTMGFECFVNLYYDDKMFNPTNWSMHVETQDTRPV